MGDKDETQITQQMVEAAAVWLADFFCGDGETERAISLVEARIAARGALEAAMAVCLSHRSSEQT